MWVQTARGRAPALPGSGALRAARGGPGAPRGKARGWAAPRREDEPRGMGRRWRVPSDTLGPRAGEFLGVTASMRACSSEGALPCEGMRQARGHPASLTAPTAGAPGTAE